MLKLCSCYVARVFLSHLFIIPFFFDFKQVLRTFQRRYGFSAREVIAGLKKDNYIVFRPLKNGRPGNVIFAQKKVISRNTMRSASIPLFILKKSITIPTRPFLFIPDAVLETMLDRVGAYYAHISS